MLRAMFATFNKIKVKGNYRTNHYLQKDFIGYIINFELSALEPISRQTG